METVFFLLVKNRPESGYVLMERVKKGMRLAKRGLVSASEDYHEIIQALRAFTKKTKNKNTVELNFHRPREVGDDPSLRVLDEDEELEVKEAWIDSGRLMCIDGISLCKPEPGKDCSGCGG